jgi:uncharacterized protein YqgC (DUF456 family)
VTLLRSQVLFVVALLYAGAVSLYITTSTPGVIAASSADASFALAMGVFAFLNMLGIAIAFMILVAVIDLIARRDQQLLLALSIGLVATATWEGASQVAFIQSYAYYTSTQAKPGEQPPAPVR